MSANINTSTDQVNSKTTLTVGPKQDFFAWLPNCIVYDWGLSAEAIAVALYLNGKPAGWQTRPFDIQNHFKWGQRIWRRVSKELKECGLITEKKHAGGTSLRFELPELQIAIKQKNPPLQNVTVLKPTVTKRNALAKKDLTKKDLITEKETLYEKNEITKKQNNISAEEAQIIFDRLWGVYPLKKAKQKAKEALFRIFKGEARAEIEKLTMKLWEGLNACITEHMVKTELKDQGGDVWVPNLPHLTTWLNQRRWEDNYQTVEEILKTTQLKGQGLNLNKYEAQWS